MGPRADRIARRTVIATMALSLVACRRGAPARETSPADGAMSAEAAAPASRELLADVRAALDDAFGPLSWEERDPERVQTSGSACSYASTTWRCDTYLGHESSTPEQLADVLAPVLRDHGWPEPPVPTGGTGGWLTSESAHDGLTFRFRSKGAAEISVDGTVTGTCQLPSEAGEPSDGG